MGPSEVWASKSGAVSPRVTLIVPPVGVRRKLTSDPKSTHTGRTSACGAGARRRDDQPQHLFEVLAGAASGAAVDVPGAAALEPETGPAGDVVVERAAVVDDERDGGVAAQGAARVRQHLGDAVAVGGDGAGAGALGGGAQLQLAAVIEAEQLVGISVLLVVVDQARVW